MAFINLLLVLLLIWFVALEFERPLPDLVAYAVFLWPYEIDHSPQLFFALIPGHVMELQHIHFTIEKVVHKRLMPSNDRQFSVVGSSIFYIGNPRWLVSLPCTSAIMFGY